MEKVLAIINIIVGLLAFSLQVINTTTCCVIGPFYLQTIGAISFDVI
jgi:hypothetical protein